MGLKDSTYATSAAAAMVGVAKEAKLMLEWMRDEDECYLYYSYHPFHKVGNCDHIRLSTFRVMKHILEKTTEGKDPFRMMDFGKKRKNRKQMAKVLDGNIPAQPLSLKTPGHPVYFSGILEFYPDPSRSFHAQTTTTSCLITREHYLVCRRGKKRANRRDGAVVALGTLPTGTSSRFVKPLSLKLIDSTRLGFQPAAAASLCPGRSPTARPPHAACRPLLYGQRVGRRDA